MERNQILYFSKNYGLKNILSLNNGDTITNPYDIGNTLTITLHL